MALLALGSQAVCAQGALATGDAILSQALVQEAHRVGVAVLY